MYRGSDDYQLLIFTENIGAVRELSKVIDNLRHRIDELETHNVRMSSLSLKSNKSLSSKSLEYKLSPQDGSIFSKRGIQRAMVSIMTFCLLIMAILYFLDHQSTIMSSCPCPPTSLSQVPGQRPNRCYPGEGDLL